MNINIIKHIMVISILTLLMMSCQNQNSNSQKQETTDTLHIDHKFGELIIPKSPKRAVVLDVGALETMHELGIHAAGVPKKFLPDYLNDIKDDPNVADVGSVIEPDFEAIAKVKPDVIFISTRLERFYKEINEIAPTVFIGADNKNYLSSFGTNVKLIGKIYGQEKLANEKLEAVDSKIKSAQGKYKQDPHKALFLIYNNGKFSAFGQGSRFGFIHDVLGIKPVLDLNDESVHGQRVSNELIAEANPDYLFVVDRNAAVLGKVSSKEEVENQLIKQTKAYKNGKMFYLNPNVWFISGGGLTSVNLMVDDILNLI